MSLPPLRPSYNLTLAETISWLAWGRHFSEQEFSAAESVDDHRRQIGWIEERLSELSEERSVLESQPASALSPEEDQELIELAVLRQRGGSIPPMPPRRPARSMTELALFTKAADENLAAFQRALEYGKNLIPRFEAASGYEYGSVHFCASIACAQHNLWEAIKEKLVKAWGKLDDKDPEWFEIEPQRFWVVPRPHAQLTHGWIEWNGLPSNDSRPRYIVAVRFERPQIEALRPQSGPVVTHSPPPGRRRGRKPELDSDAFWREVVRIANTSDGLPSLQADLERTMLTWCLEKWGKEPSTSWVRERINKLPAYSKR